MGWTAIKNGALLALVAGEFDAFVTVDRNLTFKQNTKNLPVAVIVLRARSNRLADIRTHVAELLAAIDAARPGDVVSVGAI